MILLRCVQCVGFSPSFPFFGKLFVRSFVRSFGCFFFLFPFYSFKFVLLIDTSIAKRDKIVGVECVTEKQENVKVTIGNKILLRAVTTSVTHDIQGKLSTGAQKTRTISFNKHYLHSN